MTDHPKPLADPRPWWRRPGTRRSLAVVYLVPGVGYCVGAVVFHGGSGTVLGPIWVLAGLVMLLRTRTTLRDGVLQVPARAFGRRRVAVSDVATFALPHPFATTLAPSAVLRNGDRVLLRDVDATLLQAWSEATGVPVVRDSEPEPPRSSRAALS